MHRRDWLLMIIGSYIEPIQVQKTLFKFASEASVPATQQYRFEPYNWGPCSMQIYGDLAQLRRDRLVEFVPTGRGWSAYRLTDEGKQAVDRLRRRANAVLLSELDRIREWVTVRAFSKLLRDVYKEYPEYAKSSLFEGK